MRRKRRAVVVTDAPDQAKIQATDKHSLARQLDTLRRLNVMD
jgi:hypothetical protein